MRLLVEQGHAHRKNQRKLLKRLARLYVRCLDY
jgi:hypothetical protein